MNAPNPPRAEPTVNDGRRMMDYATGRSDGVGGYLPRFEVLYYALGWAEGRRLRDEGLRSTGGASTGIGPTDAQIGERTHG